MIFQYFPLAGCEQLPPLGDLRFELEFESIGPFRTILVDDGNDQAVVGCLVHLSLVAESAQSAAKVGIVMGELALHSLPRLVIVRNCAQRLLGPARKGQRGLDSPRDT